MPYASGSATVHVEYPFAGSGSHSAVAAVNVASGLSDGSNLTIGTPSALGSPPIKFPALTGDNPIFRDAFTADPAPLVVGNTVYVYCGHDEANDSQLYNMTEWLCYSTTDMKTWTAHGPIMKPTDFAWAVSDAWASQVVQKDGLFYFYGTVQNGAGGKAIGVAVSSSPTGPFVDARGSALVNDGMTTGGDVWDDIDPTVFRDNDGTWWLGWGHGTFYLAKLKPDMTELDGAIQATKLPSYVEGPWLFKRDNTYYLAYPAIDDGGGEKTAYATAASVTGPWTYRGLITTGATNSYTIQPGIVEFQDQWYCFYHNATLTLNGVGPATGRRSVCLDYLDFNPDGTIKPVVQTTTGVSVARTSPTDLTTAIYGGGVRLGWNTVPGAASYNVKCATVSGGPYVTVQTVNSPSCLDTGVTNGATYYYVVSAVIAGSESSNSPQASVTLQSPAAPRAWLKFDESSGTSAADGSGNGWTGTLVGGATWQSGAYSNAVALNGADGYVSLPSGVVNGLNNFTLLGLGETEQHQHLVAHIRLRDRDEQLHVPDAQERQHGSGAIRHPHTQRRRAIHRRQVAFDMGSVDARGGDHFGIRGHALHQRFGGRREQLDDVETIEPWRHHQ